MPDSNLIYLFIGCAAIAWWTKYCLSGAQKNLDETLLNAMERATNTGLSAAKDSANVTAQAAKTLAQQVGNVGALLIAARKLEMQHEQGKEFVGSLPDVDGNNGFVRPINDDPLGTRFQSPEAM